ncbi:bcl-2-binding component 3 [Nyctibius grandis]|uniref:bcl-2-binding component 3 n=1 Tax=Nyctibius grandis TaxID=48427 RepID=UPI0035BC4D80
MARALREGTLREPPAPLPACGGGRWRGGALALPVPPLPCVAVSPPLRRPRRPPRMSCACLGAPPPHTPPPHPAAAPPNFILYRCGTRGPPAAAHGEFHPTEDAAHEGPPQTGGSQEGAVPNGHLPGEAPGPEQELGARLRRLGDAFQQTYEQQQREQRGVGVFWGHLYRLVSQWLGAGYDLQAAALPPREAN